MAVYGLLLVLAGAKVAVVIGYTFIVGPLDLRIKLVEGFPGQGLSLV